jgi:hypothetical protein
MAAMSEMEVAHTRVFLPLVVVDKKDIMTGFLLLMLLLFR